MPVCGQPTWMDCAHEASKALFQLGAADLRGKGLYGCEICKFPLRAHEMGRWASSYPIVSEPSPQGTYLIYQVRDIDNQGHVFVLSKSLYYGNGNYDWPRKNQKGGNIATKIFKII